MDAQVYMHKCCLPWAQELAQQGHWHVAYPQSSSQMLSSPAISGSIEEEYVQLFTRRQ